LYPGYSKVIRKKQMDLKVSQVSSVHFTPFGLAFMSCCLRREFSKDDLASAALIGTSPFRATIVTPRRK
jgi:hypothetical protein